MLLLLVLQSGSWHVDLRSPLLFGLLLTGFNTQVLVSSEPAVGFSHLSPEITKAEKTLQENKKTA